jgi:hypothetical protein
MRRMWVLPNSGHRKPHVEFLAMTPLPLQYNITESLSIFRAISKQEQSIGQLHKLELTI